MHLKNKPPVFVPAQFVGEFEKLSKAALMDIAWDYAMQMTGTSDDKDAAAELRERAALINNYRRK